LWGGSRSAAATGIRDRLAPMGQSGELLAPTYGWFTEGFDTADLQEATNMARTSLTSVGSNADSAEPLLRPLPAIGHDAKILAVSEPSFGYDVETYSSQCREGRGRAEPPLKAHAGSGGDRGRPIET
jgi:hypothetical protein